MKITQGLLEEARHCASPNCDARAMPDIDLIVIHSISLPAGHYGADYVESLFLNCLPTRRHPDFATLEGMTVSSHLLIRRDGEIVQFVPFDKRAWHAGESTFNGRERCNDFSIGIELEGTDKDTFRDIQYEKLVEVCRSLCDEYDIPWAHIVGHSDIAPGRKTDPGTGFEWHRLRSSLSESAAL